MNLHDIQQILKTMARGSTCTVSKEQFGGLALVETLLQDGFGVKTLTLREVAVDVDQAVLRGRAPSVTYLQAEFRDTELEFAFSEEKQGLNLTASLTLPDSFDPLPGLPQRFRLEQPTGAVQGREHFNHAFVRVGADFCFGSLCVPVKAGYVPGHPRWTIETSPEFAAAAGVSLADVFALLDLKGQESLVPQQVQSLIQAIAVSEIHLVWDEAKKALQQFSINLSLTHSGSWVLMRGIEIDRLSLRIEVDYQTGVGPDPETAGADLDEGPNGESPAVTLTFNGEFSLQGSKLPLSVILSGGDQTLTVVIAPAEGFALDDFSTLAGLVGAIDPSSLPPGYAHGSLVLDTLLLTVGVPNETDGDLLAMTARQSMDAVAVQAFSLAVQLQNPLNVAGVFSVQQITFAYELLQRENEKQSALALLGEFTIAEVLPFGLQVKKSSAEGWTVVGYTLGPDEISFPALLDGIGGQIVPAGLPVPDFGLSSLRFHCGLAEHAFELSGGVFVRQNSNDLLQFESISADFSLRCQQNEGQWQYAAAITNGTARLFSSTFHLAFTLDQDDSFLTLEWSPDNPDAFSLEAFCQAIGLDFALPDFLDISLQKVCFHYDFHTGELKLDTTTGAGDRLFFRSMLVDAKREYLLALAVPFDFSLGGLPLVGSAVPLLEDVRLQNLKALMVSRDMEVELPEILPKTAMKRGFYLASALKLPDREIPLHLPVPAGKQADNDASPARLSVKVEKAIGPFSLHQLNLSLAEGTLWFGLDAGFASSVLAFGLEGLSVGYTLKDQHLALKLDGLSLDLHRDPLSLGGSFWRRDAATYQGSARLGLKAVSLTAVGAYTAGEISSVFLFALLRANIGGPPCFFVTGLAAGFGCSRSLAVPGVDELQDFPLLQAADGKLSENEILQNESAYFPPAKGENWFAAGVLFNSFKMVDSFALLTAQFGNETEIDLLGRSELTVPYGLKPEAGAPPLAHAVLLLKASLRPASGVFSLEAALANDSYLFSKDCHLTGGFAFCLWFAGERQGDFVLSLGGYSDRYQKPAHYPSVKRLGLSWRITDELSVSGSIYFALTPSCVMAGGYMKLLFTSSIVEAWFDATIDVIIQWQPYRYQLYAAVNIGVKVDLWLTTLRLELGCGLDIWGPEFSGKAQVQLWCISFTISFGNADGPAEKTYIETSEFAASFLPQPQTTVAGGVAADTPAYAGIGIQALQGLLEEYTMDGDQKYWNMNAYSLEIATQSAVPSTELAFNGRPYAPEGRNPGEALAPLHVRPCQSVRLISKQVVAVARQDGAPLDAEFEAVVRYANMPAALWAQDDYPQETILAATGFVFRLVLSAHYELSFTTGVHHLDTEHTFSIPALTGQTYAQQKAYAYIQEAQSQDVSDKRAELLRTLGLGDAPVRLTKLSQNPAALFTARPHIASIGGD